MGREGGEGGQGNKEQGRSPATRGMQENEKKMEKGGTEGLKGIIERAVEVSDIKEKQ